MKNSKSPISSSYPKFIPLAEKVRWYSLIEKDCPKTKERPHLFTLTQRDHLYRFQCSKCGKCLSVIFARDVALEMIKQGVKEVPFDESLRDPRERIEKDLYRKSIQEESKKLQAEYKKNLRGNLRVMETRIVDYAQYQAYLESDQWKILRSAILKRDNYICKLCAYTTENLSELNAHHNTYIRLGNEDPKDLITLCNHCHKLFHFGSLNKI